MADVRAEQVEAVVPRTVVLVEGISDRAVISALARRLGRDLDAEGVEIVAMGGAHAVGRFVEQFGPRGLGVRLAGLCDVGEERYFQRALERAGLGSDLSRDDMEALGFYVCVRDLEEELIRALGAAAVLRVVDAHGELESFRTFEKQPAWRGRPPEEQLRRFLTSQSRRRLQVPLTEALELDRIPRPLERLVAHL
jgi:hypothetical protein